MFYTRLGNNDTVMYSGGLVGAQGPLRSLALATGTFTLMLTGWFKNNNNNNIV